MSRACILHWDGLSLRCEAHATCCVQPHPSGRCGAGRMEYALERSRWLRTHLGALRWLERLTTRVHYAAERRTTALRGRILR